MVLGWYGGGRVGMVVVGLVAVGSGVVLVIVVVVGLVAVDGGVVVVIVVIRY